MRVILDANVLISYLLAPEKQGTISTIHTCLTEDVVLVTPQELIQEIQESVSNSDYLHTRIPRQEVESLTRVLASISEVPTPLAESVPEYTADPDDDYLIAYGLFFDVDFLVTGDAHLLTLKSVEGLKIVQPSEFVEVLNPF